MEDAYCGRALVTDGIYLKFQKQLVNRLLFVKETINNSYLVL